MKPAGLVFNIQRFSIHDGPGIRTTVFLKGCAMQCFWCHNPEGRHPYQEVIYVAERCIACGNCVVACPHNAHVIENGTRVFLRDRCKTSGECIATCYSSALTMSGTFMTVDEVVSEVLRDKVFYESSKGGVTLSGGEPAFDSGFAGTILERCKMEGLHTAIETCGYCSWLALEALLPVTDMIMMDIKLITPEEHQAATGNSNERILDNARKLALTGKPIIFRTPIVPTVNDSDEEFGKITSFVKGLVDLRLGNGAAGARASGISYELLTFHKLASDKYRSLGLEYKASHIDPLEKNRMQELVALAQAQGIDVRMR
ncbi:MAG: glycyl-radical enzyme activating protein [Bacteroidota bacterium]